MPAVKTKKRKRVAPFAITQKNTKYFSLWCLSTSHKPDFAKETELSRLARKHKGEATGSGTCLKTGKRDHSFAFLSLAAASAFMREAVKRRLLQPTVSYIEWYLDWQRLDVPHRDYHYNQLCKKQRGPR